MGQTETSPCAPREISHVLHRAPCETSTIALEDVASLEATGVIIQNTLKGYHETGSRKNNEKEKKEI
jgi:hypothetical protein